MPAGLARDDPLNCTAALPSETLPTTQEISRPYGEPFLRIASTVTVPGGIPTTRRTHGLPCLWRCQIIVGQYLVRESSILMVRNLDLAE